MILVTGGTGFVGQEVVRELLALRYRVRLVARHPGPTTPFANHPGVEIIKGDVLQPETLPAAMKGVQAVIHLIGIIAETSQVTFEQAHVEATRNVLAAAQKAGVTRWIQMSAAGTRARAHSRYHLSKWQAEELVRQSGLDWTIFRPSLIYGYDERDRLLNLFRLVLSGPLPFIPLLDGGRVLVQPVSVCEVARCLARAPAKVASLGQTYELVGPVAFSWRELVSRMAGALGRDIADEGGLGLVLGRIFLRLAVVVSFIAVIASLVWGTMGLGEAELIAAVGMALMMMASRWRQVIIFSLPSGPFLVLGQILERFAPRSLQFNEQFKMALEDNVGDPGPAARTFGYVPEKFEEGVSRLLRRV